jgi:hypothetical protein
MFRHVGGPPAAHATFNFMRGLKLRRSQAHFFPYHRLCLITVSVPVLHSRCSGLSLRRLYLSEPVLAPFYFQHYIACSAGTHVPFDH